MAFSVTICLTTPETEAGNFSLYHTSITPGNLMYSNLTKQELINSFFVAGIPNESTELYLVSNDECTNFIVIDVSVPPTPTPSPSPTPTPTATPTPTPTPTATPGPTPTPTPTPWPTMTPTYTPTSTPTPTPTPGPCADCVAHDVTIGSQIWAGCNLDVTTYRNGDPIPQVTDPNAWAMLSTGAWCYYENNSANGTTYGKLYNIYAILDPRGIAPVGYHVPNNTEWTTLTATLGGGTWVDLWGDGTTFFQPGIGSALAEATNDCHWMSWYLNPTNSSGFTALPGGSRATAGYFISLQVEAIFASSTKVSNTPGIDQIWGHTIDNINTGFERSWVSPNQGISVRLIKD